MDENKQTLSEYFKSKKIRTISEYFKSLEWNGKTIYADTEENLRCEIERRKKARERFEKEKIPCIGDKRLSE